MLKLIEGLPSGVMGIEAVGNVTHEDYQNILIPKAEAMMLKGPIKMLYVIGPGFTDYKLEALWDEKCYLRILSGFCGSGDSDGLAVARGRSERCRADAAIASRTRLHATQRLSRSN